MGYRVCIPCAGTGSRLGGLTKFINKSLVGVANRPVLSHLIECFPNDCEFVIALGYKGHLVRDFLELAYPERKIYFVDVAPFEGYGSGLGFSLLACKDYLQCPFVFISCDTLVEEPIPVPDENWIGFAETTAISDYRTIKLVDSFVEEIADKGAGIPGTHWPYIGLSGIKDYEEFWRAMEGGSAQAVEAGEAHGLRQLCAKSIRAHRFTWYDTGTPEALELTRECFRELGEPNILDKANEAIWFVGDRVIKFCDDQKFIANRVKRVSGLAGFVPEVIDSRPNMYLYKKIEGTVLSDVVTLPLFDRLLDRCKSFWTPAKLDGHSHARFKTLCKMFYRDKTFERVEKFYKAFDKSDGKQPINGIEMPKLQSLLESLDWDWLSDGIPTRFHGDFHFENILWNESVEQFTFLDWRQDFGGDLAVGDVYYDLAKLLHGLIVNHGLIAQNRFKIIWTTSRIDYDLERRQILVECERVLDSWLERTGYDKRKVLTLTGLIYLNIAALHHYPYSILLYALGKSILKSQIK